MDLRTPRPVERRDAQGSEPPLVVPQEPQTKKEIPTPVQRIGGSHHVPKEEKSKKRFIVPIILVTVIVLFLVGWLVAISMRGGSNAQGIDSSKYQAVFFTNGQVYFGKLESFNDESMKLTDIFYLQTQDTAVSEEGSENPQETAPDQGNVQLIKLGSEVHGPEDEMILSKAQVLFYENLKTDSKVTKTIDDYKKQ